MEPMGPLSSGQKSAITQRETIDTEIDQSGASETSRDRRSNPVHMMNRRSQYCIRVASPLPGSGCLPACVHRAFSPGYVITCLQPRRLMMSARLRLSLFGSLPASGRFWVILTNFDQIRRATEISDDRLGGPNSGRRVTASGRSADFNPPGATVGRAARFLTPGPLRTIRRNEFRAPMRSAGFRRL